MSSPLEPTDLCERRRFLRGMLAGAALGGASAWAQPFAAAHEACEQHPERSFVLLQLTGGNDGLSTVVPYSDDGYARSRAKLRLGADEVLRIEEGRGLHPLLRDVRAMYHAGYLAIVEGVGSPGPSLSHFQALERWHTAEERGRIAAEGWIGRLCAALDPHGTRPLDPLHLGPNPPRALHSRTRLATCLDSVGQFEWLAGTRGIDAYLSAFETTATQDSSSAEPLARLRATLRSARASTGALQDAVRRYRTPVEYPADAFGRRLRDVAALIEARAGARVFSLELGNFDTHADQRYFHDALMRVLDAGMSAFLRDLQRSEAGRDTLVLAFSEFGRRVEENASGGTDHGTAGPLFLFGARVAAGLHGEHPSLAELQDGNLAVRVDFRSVYATVIEDWFGLPHTAVLGATFPRLALIGG